MKKNTKTTTTKQTATPNHPFTLSQIKASDGESSIELGQWADSAFKVGATVALGMITYKLYSGQGNS